MVMAASIRRWAAVGLVLAGGVCAQEPQADGDDAEIGGGRWSANVRGVGFYTDNFFYQPESAQGAWGWLIRPEMGYLAESGRTQLRFGANGEYGTFDVPGAAKDYVDAAAKLDAGFQASTRNRLELVVGGKRGHDPLGLDRTETAPSATAELDEWTELTGGVRHRFGSSGAIMNTEVGVSGQRRHYVSNRAATQFLDYDATTADAALFYNLSPKTAAVIDVIATQYEFEYPFAPSDNRSGRLLRSRVGVRWLATAKTSGDVRVGLRQREFDNSGDTFEGVDWEAGVQWRPVWPGLIKLSTGRSELPSYLSGTRSIDLQHASAEWQQPWTARLNSRLGVRSFQSDFLGASRTDDLTQGTLDVEYRMTRTALAVANLSIGSRDSTAAGREFDRFSSFFGVQVGF